jgi:hypothetical protein
MSWGQYYTRYDTLVLTRGRWWHEKLRHSQLATACAVRVIRRLGLRMFPAKSEAIWCYDWRRRGTHPPGLCLDISREDVEVGLQMEYLCLSIDSQRTFGPHFRLLVSNVATTANALCGLLPNIGGTEARVRRLSERVVRSQVMYGAPVWI